MLLNATGSPSPTKIDGSCIILTAPGIQNSQPGISEMVYTVFSCHNRNNFSKHNNDCSIRHDPFPLRCPVWHDLCCCRILPLIYCRKNMLKIINSNELILQHPYITPLIYGCCRLYGKNSVIYCNFGSFMVLYSIRARPVKWRGNHSSRRLYLPLNGECNPSPERRSPLKRQF